MFSQSAVSQRPQASPVLPRKQRSSPVRSRASPVVTLRPSSPSPSTSPTASQRSVPKPSYRRSLDPSLAEQYTNRAYNRQPSPPCRIPRPTTSPAAPQKSGRAHDDRSPCDVIRAQRSGSTSSLASHRVLFAVKDVLSRAVMERGRIDEDNLGVILKNMKSRLLGGAQDEDRPTIEVDGKESRTTVNTKVSSDTMTKPMLGIVRKPVVDSPKPYNKVYRKNTNSTKTIKTLPDGDEVVYIDLPDSDYSNFSSLMRKNKEKVSRSNVHSEENFVCDEQNGIYEAEGFQRKDIIDQRHIEHHADGTIYPADMNKIDEDAKLQKYIEMLIRNMNDQLGGKRSCGNLEAELESKGTICKSFCLCKVCVSSNSSPKKEAKVSKVNIEPNMVEDNNVDEIEVNFKRSEAINNTSTVPNSVKQKSPLVPKKTSTNIRVVKRSVPPEPRESSPRHRTLRMVQQAQEVNPKESYTVVEPGHTEEVTDDMYLQRRLRSPARRR